MRDAFNLNAGESDQVGADTETSTRTGRRANCWRIDVENGECGKGNQRNHTNLGQLEDLAGKKVGGHCHCETLEGILHQTGHNITKV